MAAVRRHIERSSCALSRVFSVTLFLALFLALGVSGQTNSTIWPAGTVPVQIDTGPDNAVEIGVKFRSDVGGRITGLRFYKAAANTGTHVASLWSRTGSLLARATFVNETSSGWQQVNFATPVNISANTVYVASYHTAVGHYSVDEQYFAGKGMDSPPLHALANGVSGVNGVYIYSATSRFPNRGYLNTNYWVDVVFSTGSGLPDTTPPTVNTFSLPATATTLAVSISSFTATDNTAVTGYMASESATPPAAGAAGWSATAPTSYSFLTAGQKTLYGWAKDAAGNVSASRSATVTITLPETVPPTVTSFVLPATSNSLTVPITSFTASDNVAVTGYMATESAVPPSAAAAGWLAARPPSYVFATQGTRTLYAWAKDAAGNVSTGVSASVTITLPETTPPTVTSFVLPATSDSLTVPITSLTATDNLAVTGYLVTQSANQPSATAAGWSATPPSSFVFTTQGAKTLYAWAKDAAGNVSASVSALVTITLPDTSAPTVTAFTIPPTATTLTVPISSFTASDNTAVMGYLVTESAVAPLASAGGWSPSAPASYAFLTPGSKTLYGWAKDAAGNVSTSLSDSVVITLSTGGPETSGWYAGDMHVHRSCGGSPEDLLSVYNKMGPHNLAVISLLADMGNGEVQDPVTDLPKVNPQDDPISTPGRVVHWDVEWHWDATYSQYPHNALGGHLVALGLTEAYQLWEESTYKVMDWAHQRNAVVGFAHMQYLDGGIPQSLNCCIPIEYPVEVALGAADFVSEDVDDVNSGFGLYPENFIQAYYKLLNCGFRPGFAAGTDYPCNSSRPLGALLTYVRPEGGQLTYRGWIEGIAKGRTVVSRNGHNEFMSLTVNGTASPGDEIKLTAAGTVQVAIQWTAIQNLTGTIELIKNGAVVASQSSLAGPGNPATLTTTVEFAHSGWLAARRMGADGHQVHTAAVFVTVNEAPVRASVADAQFYVQWMDNLLTKTSPGGPWNSFFLTNLANAQSRYQSAKAIYQQIATEAAALIPATPTIFTTQTPTLFENDSPYELGTRFYTGVNGQITQVRLYTHALEGGNHIVRIWRAGDGVLVAGPYAWNITSGTEGWKSFALPSPLTVVANTDYIVAISNSSDQYYAEQPQGFAAPITNGHLYTYVGSGVYGTTLGAMPTSTWSNTNYFRDIVFTPQN